MGSTGRRVSQNDQRGRFLRALSHAPEGTHLEFLDLVGAVHLALQADLLSHLPGALAEHGRGHAIGGLVHQFAREVLRFADDAGLVEGGMQPRLLSGCDHSHSVDTLVLAVALIGIGLEIADVGPFDDGLDRLLAFNPVLRRHEGKTAQAA